MNRRRISVDRLLTPKLLILAWLEQAHQFDSITDYARSTLEQPGAPISRMLDTASRAAGRPTRSRPLEAVRSAVRRTQGDILFLYELVLGLNTVGAAIAQVQALRLAVLRLQLQDLLANPILNERSKEPTGRPVAAALDGAWRGLRETAQRVIDEIAVEAAARRNLEERYLDGRPVLFPAVARDWAGLLEQAADLGVYVESLPDTVGRTTRRPTVRATAAASTFMAPSVDERARARARELADDARVEAFLRLGDRPRALAIEERRLRALIPTTEGTPID